MSLETIVIADPHSGARASFLPGFGFNCFSFQVLYQGKPVETLWTEPGFEGGDKRASASGIPLLFPYAGRLRGKTLDYGGRAYPLEGDDGRGNAIHGFVVGRPWRVVEHGPARVVGRFQASVDAPEVLACWPADFRITATYEVAGTTLSSRFLIENPADRPLPFGFGTHPAFRVPLGPGVADDWRVVLPVRRRWELAAMLPTGRVLPVEEAEADQRGLRFADMALDDVFTGLVSDNGVCRARIVGPSGGLSLVIEFDAAFRACVVFTPPHREAVCIEPYTCVPNAFELAAAGADTGLQFLGPGESFAARIVMRVEACPTALGGAFRARDTCSSNGA